MKETLIITDVTRMNNGHVCIAGITSNNECRRPVFKFGQIPEEWLYDKKSKDCVIFPFAVVEFDFLGTRSNAPHTEDRIIDPHYKKFTGNRVAPQELLPKIADPSVRDIFGAEIYHDMGYFIKEGEGNRSLGTVKVNIKECFFGHSYGRLDYRISFNDEEGVSYRLRVTDLSFRYYCQYLQDKEQWPYEKISRHLNEQLRGKTVYLRIGLARPTWKERPHCCFLQITGIYSFPDYLEGRCFADFYQPEFTESIPF